MIYPADFQLAFEAVTYRADDKRVMARVALNALIDPELYPVDLAEIRGMRYDARTLTLAFLAYMATNPQEYGAWGAARCAPWLEVAHESPAIASSSQTMGDNHARN